VEPSALWDRHTDFRWPVPERSESINLFIYIHIVKIYISFFQAKGQYMLVSDTYWIVNTIISDVVMSSDFKKRDTKACL